MTLSKEHMSLQVKKQGELMSYRNQRKELNEEEKGTVGNKERWRKSILQLSGSYNTLRYHFPNFFPAARALLTLQNLDSFTSLKTKLLIVRAPSEQKNILLLLLSAQSKRLGANSFVKVDVTVFHSYPPTLATNSESAFNYI